MLVEFTYNNPYQASIGMTPIKVLYRRPCKSPTCRQESQCVVVVGSQLLQEAMEKVNPIKKIE